MMITKKPIEVVTRLETRNATLRTQKNNPNAVWVILTHKSSVGNEAEIERRLAPSPEDAPRIAVLMLCARDKLEHGDIVRVLRTRATNDK